MRFWAVESVPEVWMQIMGAPSNRELQSLTYSSAGARDYLSHVYILPGVVSNSS